MIDSATAPTHDQLDALARRVAGHADGSGLGLATAESCTGGWIAKVLTDQAGSSGWFHGGVVSYSNAAKVAMLDVPGSLLEAYGAVSEPVVRAMAAGMLARSGSDVAVAVTGIAGPGGGVPGKPVGRVWFGWALATGFVISRAETFEGDREAVRAASVAAALEGVLRHTGGEGAA